MSTDEQYDMRGLLSGLLAKVKEGQGPDLVLLRDEIKKEISAGDKTLDKFLELVESFQEVLPKEKQRYNVAIRALHTTSGVSRQDILGAVDNQLEELRRLEKGALSALTGFRDELTDMDSRLQETKSELTKLRVRIAELEKEEREILRGLAARERERKLVEEAVRKVFADSATEIRELKKKIEETATEKVSPQLSAHPYTIEVDEHERDEIRSEEEFKIGEIPAEQETEWLKRCPMCGGEINFILKESKWMCYSCGHEEPGRVET